MEYVSVQPLRNSNQDRTSPVLAHADEFFGVLIDIIMFVRDREGKLKDKRGDCP